MYFLQFVYYFGSKQLTPLPFPRKSSIQQQPMLENWLSTFSCQMISIAKTETKAIYHLHPEIHTNNNEKFRNLGADKERTNKQIK